MFCIIKNTKIIGFIAEIEQSNFLLKEDPTLSFRELPAYTTEKPHIEDFKLVGDTVVFEHLDIKPAVLNQITGIIY